MTVSRTLAAPGTKARLRQPWVAISMGVAVGVVVGALVGVGGQLTLLVAVAAVVVLLGFSVQTRSASLLPLAALTLACLPALIWFPFLIPLGGKSVYFTDVLLPLAALMALLRPSRSPRTDLVVWVYSLVMGLQTAVGLANGQPFNAFTQDLRGPLYIVCGYFIASRLYTSARVRQVLGATGFVLWWSAGLMLFTIATGIDVLAGRTEDVRAYQAAGPEVIDATRFIVDSKGLAFITLVTGTTVLVSRVATPHQRRVAALLVAPALIVTFLNYARATVLALLVCAVLVLALRRLAQVQRRRIAVTALVVSTFVAIIGLTGTASVFADPQGNVLARQVAGFQERVIGGLDAENVESPGNTYRLLENRYALEAIARNPLFGQGVGAAFKPQSFGDPSLDAFQTDPAFGVRFIHNGWLWYLVKGGVVALLAFVALMLAPVVQALYRSARSRARLSPADVGLLVSVIGLLAIFVFEPDIHRTGSAPLVGATLGYLSILGRPASGAPSGSRRLQPTTIEREGEP